MPWTLPSRLLSFGPRHPSRAPSRRAPSPWGLSHPTQIRTRKRPLSTSPEETLPPALLASTLPLAAVDRLPAYDPEPTYPCGATPQPPPTTPTLRPLQTDPILLRRGSHLVPASIELSLRSDPSFWPVGVCLRPPLERESREPLISLGPKPPTTWNGWATPLDLHRPVSSKDTSTPTRSVTV